MRIEKGKPANNIFLTIRPDFSGLNEIEESVRRMLSEADVHIVEDPLEADV